MSLGELPVGLPCSSMNGKYSLMPPTPMICGHLPGWFCGRNGHCYSSAQSSPKMARHGMGASLVGSLGHFNNIIWTTLLGCLVKGLGKGMFPNSSCRYSPECLFISCRYFLRHFGHPVGTQSGLQNTSERNQSQKEWAILHLWLGCAPMQQAHPVP